MTGVVKNVVLALSLRERVSAEWRTGEGTYFTTTSQHTMFRAGNIHAKCFS